jgi:hypothetical protein
MSASKHQNAPPRSVAISGILFAILFMGSLAIVRLAIPSDPSDPGSWLADQALHSRIGFALKMVPFTGIAFLWFMATLRYRIGLLEDRLFSTVFLGSGFLFVAMLFAAVSVSRGLLETFTVGLPYQSDAYRVGRVMAYALMNMFGIKMAAVFMFVTSTIGFRTGALAHWVSFVGFACGLVMLFALRDFAWIELLFPMWVLVVSIYVLCSDSPRGSQAEDGD